MGYPGIDCPMKEVLELMELSADELVCREVLDTIVEQVSKAAEKDALENLLKQMSPRPVYHFLDVLDDSTTHKRDFLVEMTADQREIYERKISLEHTPVELALLTQGQSTCTRMSFAISHFVPLELRCGSLCTALPVGRKLCAVFTNTTNVTEEPSLILESVAQGYLPGVLRIV
ncbi:hypothetical protein HPB50_012913 [Hyalomma asiaticum]|uniref:Uncharacterized protein n=1 Tax=Hyalomma asiaticum TaxID=266040 RepID=A0ACB7RTM4_HYAAI|nr:hypothetical protein HPB50_012913 [Hyalomma asiaticum]